MNVDGYDGLVASVSVLIESFAIVGIGLNRLELVRHRLLKLLLLQLQLLLCDQQPLGVV